MHFLERDHPLSKSATFPKKYIFYSQLRTRTYVYHRVRNETKYSRMGQVKFFKGCLSQILLGPFLNTLPQIIVFQKIANALNG